MTISNIGPLDLFRQTLADKIAGEDNEKLRKQGLCIDCKQPAIENCYSDAGKKEYFITGFCEKCFDKICM